MTALEKCLAHIDAYAVWNAGAGGREADRICARARRIELGQRGRGRNASAYYKRAQAALARWTNKP